MEAKSFIWSGEIREGRDDSVCRRCHPGARVQDGTVCNNTRKCVSFPCVSFAGWRGRQRTERSRKGEEEGAGKKAAMNSPQPSWCGKTFCWYHEYESSAHTSRPDPSGLLLILSVNLVFFSALLLGPSLMLHCMSPVGNVYREHWATFSVRANAKDQCQDGRLSSPPHVVHVYLRSRRSVAAKYRV